MHVHICVNTHVYLNVYAHDHVYVFICVNMCVCLCVPMCVCTNGLKELSKQKTSVCGNPCLDT